MRRALSCLIVAFLLSCAPSFAQTFGQITGMVTDSTGGVLVGATVTVTNTQTGATVVQQANTAGLYVFPNLLPGVYNVKVEMDGFRGTTRSRVELQIQQAARVDFKLEIGALNETVEAVGTAPMLNTSDATIGTVIDSRQVVELPLNGRNFIRLVALSPNVTADYGGASGGGASGRQGGDRTTQSFSIAGQRREYNQYTLDGIANQDVNFNTYAFLPSIDAVEEFKVQTGVYSAEFGREAAQVNVSTKSGTNEFHGALFEFVRNDALDARPYAFTTVRPEKSPFKWNQFGFTLGGPVKIPHVVNGTNKLFFMANYEGFRLRQQQQVVYDVPSAAMRKGNFSEISTQIVDPANNRAPFAGNIIPTNRLDPIAIKLLEFYPEPNIPGAGLSKNYLALQNHTTDKDQFTGRVDFVESQKSFWFGRYSWTDEFVRDPALKDNGQTVATNVKQVMISNTRTFTPSIVNEFRFGATKFYNNLAQELQYERDVIKEFGIGLFDPPPIGWGLPSIGINGFSGFGAGAAVPFVGTDKIFQVIDNVSWIKGSHSMKMGLEIRKDMYDMIGTQEIRGTLTINQPQTGYGFADYMLGMLNQTRSAGAFGTAKYRTMAQSYFFQDAWRFKSNLSLDLGLRYEYTPPWLDAQGELMNIWLPKGFGTDPNAHPCFIRIGKGDVYEGVSTRFDPAICVARDGRLGDRLVKDDKTNFAPRIGFAWTPTPKTTVRTGFGVFYVQDTTNPVFDMSRNIQGRITSTGTGLTFANPYAVSANNPCGVQMPPQVCVTAPQVLSNQYDRRTPYIEEYLLNVQRELNGSTALEIGYFGNQGHRLQRFITLNQPVPGLSLPSLNRAMYPELGNMQHVASVGQSYYHALALKLTRRLANNLQGLVSYTWSKSIDNGSGIRVLGTDPLKPEKGDCPNCEWGLSVFDARHRFTTSFLYDLPVGPGQKYLSSGALGRVIGAWQLGGIVRASSGFPLTVTTSLDQSLTSHGYDRPNVVSTVSSEVPSDQRSAAQWFNVSAFQMNPLGTFGNVGRSTVIGPGIFTTDFSAIKNIHMGTRNLQVRIEAFNLFNQVNLADPNTNIANSNWNAAGANGVPTFGGGTFGQITEIRATVPMRQLQFALKLGF
jgi:Carboxypeptidase regulatory-like domain